MMNRKHLKITLICAIFLLTGATMGCVDELITIEEDFEMVVNDPIPAPTHSDSYYRLVEPTPTPAPTPTPTPTMKSPSHADGNPRTCGTCHTYPKYDKDNNPYRAAPMPTPAPVKTPTHTLPSYVIPSSNNPIPSDYYSQDCKLPTDQSMQEYLAKSEWVDDYDIGGWDCSQMSTYMEFMLENCGYNVVIRVADVEGEQYGHAWILVEFQQGWLAYECTGRYWVYPSEAVARSYDPYGYVHWNPSMYEAGVQYGSIYNIWDGYKQYSNGEEVFLAEYGWWVE